MPRRTATMLASTLLLIAVLCAAILFKVPYAAISPGPTYNTLGSVDGEQVLSFPGEKDVSGNAASGHLNMTTVSVSGPNDKMDLFRAIYGWLAEDMAVVPRETLYPSDKSAEEVKEQNAEEFSRSQESAKVVALRKLGKKVPTRVVVQTVFKDAAARGTLHAGDVIKAVDGTRVKDPNTVADLVTKHDPGEKVEFRVVPAKRAKKAEKDGDNPVKLPGKQVAVETKKADDGRAVVGIMPGVAHTLPMPIDITLADVGGPSAGLMFALGIVDKLTPKDLTDGAFVAGTGTIDEKGQVGPIGGIHMKTVAARNKGAEFFLTPKDNCSAATAHAPDGLILVKVDTMDDAMSALKKIRTDKTSELPRCAKD